MKEVIIKIWLYFYEYVLFNIKGMFRIIINVKQIKKLKGIHKGKRCFIVATGPSLRIGDIERLRNEYTFSVNSIFMLFKETEWRPTYYVCTDYSHLDKMIDLYGQYMDHCCKEYKFFNNISKKKLNNKIKDTIYIPISSINKLLRENEKFYFSTNIVKGIYSAGTVTNIAIIIAMYMGFEKIYLLGVDCNYSSTKKHFNVDYNDNSMKLVEAKLIETRMKNGFKQMSVTVRNRNVEVYNATRGGMLEDFPRVDFDSLFEKGEDR